MKFAASTGELPEAARFRVGVAPAGEIRYCFPLNSSGDRSLDEQAREYLALCRFPLKASSAQASPSRNGQDRPAPQHRDPRYSHCPGRDLSAAFPCGGFSPLDIWGVEPSSPRASRFALSFALRHLRVRI